MGFKAELFGALREASYFADCPRDEKGHCTTGGGGEGGGGGGEAPKGGGGGAKGGGDNPPKKQQTWDEYVADPPPSVKKQFPGSWPDTSAKEKPWWTSPEKILGVTKDEAKRIDAGIDASDRRREKFIGWTNKEYHHMVRELNAFNALTKERDRLRAKIKAKIQRRIKAKTMKG